LPAIFHFDASCLRMLAPSSSATSACVFPTFADCAGEAVRLNGAYADPFRLARSLDPLAPTAPPP
jgi:hypothetical protein